MTRPWHSERHSGGNIYPAVVANSVAGGYASRALHVRKTYKDGTRMQVHIIMGMWIYYIIYPTVTNSISIKSCNYK